PGLAESQSQATAAEVEAKRRADEPTRASGKTQSRRRKTAELRPAKRPARPAREPALPELHEFLEAVNTFLEPAPETRKTNVVPAPEPFVGREADLAAIGKAFDAGARLVTVAGFGGMGKTRLALRYLELQ